MMIKVESLIASLISHMLYVPLVPVLTHINILLPVLHLSFCHVMLHQPSQLFDF